MSLSAEQIEKMHALVAIARQCIAQYSFSLEQMEAILAEGQELEKRLTATVDVVQKQVEEADRAAHQ